MKNIANNTKKSVGLTLALGALFFGALSLSSIAEHKNTEVKMTENKISNVDTNVKTELATFGAGCFWGIEETYRQIEGVVGTAVGYMGGTVVDPTYQQICYESTGHAEVAQIEFDPQVISYQRLLEIFWKVHDPTQVNRQGPDVGSQYRTAIFFHSDEQKQIAEQSKATLTESKKHSSAIATEITPAAVFWVAEEYHQKYLQKRGLPACKLY